MKRLPLVVALIAMCTGIALANTGRIQMEPMTNPIVVAAGDSLIAIGYVDSTVYKSTDDGATWDSISVLPSAMGMRRIYRMRWGDLFVCGTNDSLYRSGKILRVNS